MPPLVEPGTHSIAVNGVDQHYRVSGSGPYCIVHAGGPGIEASYLRMPLLEQNLTMVYLDPIGTGLSGRLATHPMGYSVDRFSDQVLAFIDAVGIANPYLLGHSHGAFVMLDAALKRPVGVAGLILYAGAAYTGGDFMAAAGAEIAAFVVRHEGTAEAIAVEKAWASIPTIRTDAAYTAALRDLLPAYVSDFRRRLDLLETMRRQLQATMLVGDGQVFDVRDRLATLRAPTLVVTGTDDFILGPRHAALLADLLPQAQLKIFEESGHFVHIEEPYAFAETVIRFTGRPG
ncbi:MULTISPECIES: alpha/beta hydrolase [unclassified Methylobacterium]|uniref:alpha/beta fold hydrolase n=1 Tax=unclassified Methylobacterium TaxID=2615210 RepID=UPI000362F1AF|nr:MULTISPECIES: alpha/beta hydrolase [unclassified Methylobacterium]SEG66519.1 proline iminopeptidase [Methylobacterium sp. 190mf]